jgi:hypothetical protein
MRKLVVKLVAIAALSMSTAVGVTALVTSSSGATGGFIGESRATLHVVFRHLPPNTPYAVTLYAYHYEGDPHPYTLGYDNSLGSNAFGTYSAFVDDEDLAGGGYEGQPVYEVEACLEAKPSYAIVACTPYTYVGYVPESQWDYKG